jgi:hypothetical protein
MNQAKPQTPKPGKITKSEYLSREISRIAAERTHFWQTADATAPAVFLRDGLFGIEIALLQVAFELAMKREHMGGYARK